MPKEIGQLKNLTYLSLNLNQLNTLFVEILALKNLKKLDLWGNQLSTLPKEIGQLENLEDINLGNNHFSTLPKEIKQLKNLRTLDLYGNQLTELPNIEKLQNLKTLNLGSFKDFYPGNQLKKLPSEIGKLQNLEVLLCGDNQLTTLPAEIGNLKKLTALYLLDNELTALPVEIGNLQNLTELDLSDNLLTTLPVEIGNLQNLTKLDLGNNLLTTLPVEIGSLQNLTELDLSRNPFTTLPAEIGQLKNLRELDLSKNPITLEEGEQIKKLLPNCKVKYDREVDYSNIAFTFAEKGEYAKAYEAQKKALAKNDKNYNDWFNLSFFSLFVNKPTEAIEAAQKSLALAPYKNGVITNLVLGYVLSNQWDKAESIYKEWKDKKFNGEERLSKEIFLQDIADLEKAGITHPDFEKVKKIIQE